MAKRRPTYIPHQSKISVQDVADYSTPAGASMANEEMRRLQFGQEQLADKIKALAPDDGAGAGPQVDTPIETPDSPKFEQDFSIQKNWVDVIRKKLKEVNFVNSNSVTWEILEETSTKARIKAFVNARPQYEIAFGEVVVDKIPQIYLDFPTPSDLLMINGYNFNHYYGVIEHNLGLTDADVYTKEVHYKDSETVGILPYFLPLDVYPYPYGTAEQKSNNLIIEQPAIAPSTFYYTIVKYLL